MCTIIQSELSTSSADTPGCHLTNLINETPRTLVHDAKTAATVQVLQLSSNPWKVCDCHMSHPAIRPGTFGRGIIGPMRLRRSQPSLYCMTIQYCTAVCI